MRFLQLQSTITRGIMPDTRSNKSPAKRLAEELVSPNPKKARKATKTPSISSFTTPILTGPIIDTPLTAISKLTFDLQNAKDHLIRADVGSASTISRYTE